MNVANALTIDNETKALKAWEGQAENDAFLAMIERAARDPSVDMDKMERLISMRERMQASAAERAFEDAMAAAQEAMQPIRADANNPSTKSKYASYFALDTAIRPVYTRHGFSLSFDTTDGAPADHVRVVCKVACSGHRERPRIDMPSDGKGAKGGDVMTKTHATGSAIQYGKRYLLGMIFNIAVSKDDDGNAAGKTDTLISVDQVNELREIIEERGGDLAAFCKTGGVEALAEISVRNYAAAVRVAKQKPVTK